MNTLLTPLKYLRIRGRRKCFFDWILPAAIMSGFLATRFTPIPSIPFAGPHGVASATTEVLKILVGFYIASLCAVATFPTSVLDGTMYGPVTLRYKVKGKWHPDPEHLTRRRFLSFLFGYLAFMAITLYITGISVGWFSDLVVFWCEGIPSPLKERIVETISELFSAGYVLFSAQLLSLTLLGLHYLSDRLHRDH